MTIRALHHLKRDVVRSTFRAKRRLVRTVIEAAGDGPRYDGARSVAQPSAARPSTARSSAEPQVSGRQAAPAREAPPRLSRAELTGMTKAQLYREATTRDVAGRSKMNKAELLAALSA